MDIKPPSSSQAHESKDSIIDEYVVDGRPILIITDTWEGQINGLVTVLKNLETEVAALTNNKVRFIVITPDKLPHIKLKYQNLIMSYLSRSKLEKIMTEVNPQAIYITEWPLGVQAKWVLDKKGISYLTGYHTNIPEYGEKIMANFAKCLTKTTYSILNRLYQYFHSKSKGILVPSVSTGESLIRNGYNPKIIRYWSRGVDSNHFSPDKADSEIFKDIVKPISLYVGRIAGEKNLEDFLKMEIPGTKVLVGDGPELRNYQNKYKDALFLGRKNIDELPKYYASADIFVFTSLTDTYGLVQLEALASGIPVIGYNVQGPKDVITSKNVGVLVNYDQNNPDQNLRSLCAAWGKGMTLRKDDCRNFAIKKSWSSSALEFLYFLNESRIRDLPKN